MARVVNKIPPAPNACGLCRYCICPDEENCDDTTEPPSLPFLTRFSSLFFFFPSCRRGCDLQLRESPLNAAIRLFD